MAKYLLSQTICSMCPCGAMQKKIHHQKNELNESIYIQYQTCVSKFKEKCILFIADNPWAYHWLNNIPKCFIICI